MKNKKFDRLMGLIDGTKSPKHWRKFINKNVIDHNLILKYGKRAYCTNCKKYFDKNVIIHPYNKEKCEICGNKYYVRNGNLKNYSFFKDIGFYVNVNNQIILRIFEIESKYDFKKKKFKQDLKEFARFIPNKGIAINNAVSFFMWYQKVWHHVKTKRWHIYTGNKVLDDMPIYPHNKKRLYKGTPLEYAPIKEFKKKYPYYSDFQIIQMASYQSFELLWKMGLYELSKDAKYFNKKGNFQNRFGVPKSFLKFMVENNINYEEYKLLRLLQKPDIDLIRKYRLFYTNYLEFMKKQGLLYDLDILKKFEWNLKELMTISKYTTIKKFLTYKKGVENINLYCDYLEMANKIGFSIKSKKRLFPYQLVAWHDKISNKIKVMDDMETQFAAYLRFLELSKYIYSDDKYIIFPAPSVDDIKDEGMQQGNCVATAYMKLYIDKKTEIYFIRCLNDTVTSFITLEYNYGKVIQKELPHHSTKFNSEQIEFIDKWLGYRNFIDIKEKYKNKTEIMAKKYNLNRLVA